jgi:signal transduction histidine kinase
MSAAASDPDPRTLGSVVRTLRAALGALVAPRSWRATLHVLAGLPVGLATGAVLGALITVWGAALISLTGGPGRSANTVTYAVTVVVVPPLLPWFIRGFGRLQRARFRAVLGVDIPAPAPARGPWPLRAVRLWRSAATWRQFGYHVLALSAGTVAAALVVGCWTALATLGYTYDMRGPGPFLDVGVAGTITAVAALFAAPWLARGFAAADVAVARQLLGPDPTEQMSRRIESLSRSRAEIVAATDAERRRIERDLHDGAQQRLVSLAMNLGIARATLTDVPEPARRAIEEAHDEATQALAELREFVRGLHPAVLNDRGLDAALSGIAARSPVPVRLRVDVDRRCSPTIEAIAYFVVSEALTNIAKHAGASRAEVTVLRAGDTLRVTVGDDGRGGAAARSDSPDSTGLRGLAQRAAAVDGTLRIDSPPGGPTRITVELPCES